MKILHTESSLGYGGQEMRIVKEAQGMQKLGHKVSLLCPEKAQIGTLAQDHGLSVQILPIGKKRLSAVFILLNWLKENPQDVINTHSSTDSTRWRFPGYRDHRPGRSDRCRRPLAGACEQGAGHGRRRGTDRARDRQDRRGTDRRLYRTAGCCCVGPADAERAVSGV